MIENFDDPFRRRSGLDVLRWAEVKPYAENIALAVKLGKLEMFERFVADVKSAVGRGVLTRDQALLCSGIRKEDLEK